MREVTLRARCFGLWSRGKRSVRWRHFENTAKDFRASPEVKLLTSCCSLAEQKGEFWVN
jgi:hypothetical protein